MPSVSAAKPEKQLTSNDFTEPLRSLMVMIEKRIRNLEKRKIKLDNYRSDVEKGKELNEDQKNAVSKYNDVISWLDATREVMFNMGTVETEHVKAMKKQAKKDHLERQQHEISRLTNAFVYSHILAGFQNEDVRSDFLNGANGAVQLSSELLSQLDQLYKLIEHRPPNEQSDIKSHYRALAENLISLSEGKKKDVAGTNYYTLKQTLDKIVECKYFTKPSEPIEESSASSDELPEEEQNDQTNHVGEFSSAAEESEIVEPVHEQVIYEPEERAVLNEVVLEPQTIQTAPLQEVLEQQGSFNFLQESQIDLDAPHMDPAVVAVHQMAPAPSVNFVVNSYTNSPPVEENEKPLVNGIEPCEISIPPQQQQPVPMLSPRSVPPVLTSVQHSAQSDFDPSHPIPTQTFTNQSFAVMQNMMMPQAYVPVTLHHPSLPTTIAVISPAPTGVHVPVAVSVPDIQEVPKSETVPPLNNNINNEEELHSNSETDVNANGVVEEKSKESGNNYYRGGGFRGRGRGRGNNFFRGRGNYHNGRGGYQNNYYRDRNGYNDNYRRNNRGGRGGGGGGGNMRSRGNFRSDGPHQQRNNYHHQKQQQQDRPQQEETQQ